MAPGCMTWGGACVCLCCGWWSLGRKKQRREEGGGGARGGRQRLSLVVQLALASQRYDGWRCISTRILQVLYVSCTDVQQENDNVRDKVVLHYYCVVFYLYVCIWVTGLFTVDAKIAESLHRQHLLYVGNVFFIKLLYT